MTHVISCAHCFRMFTPTINIRHCPECADALARLEAECADRPDPGAARITVAAAIGRMSRLKRREPVFPPKSLRDLVVWLTSHPHVRITGPTPNDPEPVTREETFLRLEDGRLWFVDINTCQGSTIPIVCMLTESAERAETGFVFDQLGVTITKFGVPIRVEYTP